jgi:hypothetical protein
MVKNKLGKLYRDVCEWRADILSGVVTAELIK